MSAPEPKEQGENTTNEYEELEPQVKESQEEEVKIGEDQRLQVLPENEEEEKEEILLLPLLKKQSQKCHRHLKPNPQERADGIKLVQQM